MTPATDREVFLRLRERAGVADGETEEELVRDPRLLAGHAERMREGKRARLEFGIPFALADLILGSVLAITWPALALWGPALASVWALAVCRLIRAHTDP